MIKKVRMNWFFVIWIENDEDRELCTFADSFKCCFPKTVLLIKACSDNFSTFRNKKISHVVVSLEFLFHMKHLGILYIFTEKIKMMFLSEKPEYIYKPSIPFWGHRQTVQTQIRQTPQNAASDQGLHCLLTGISIRNRIKMKKLHPTPLKLEMDSSNG